MRLCLSVLLLAVVGVSTRNSAAQSLQSIDDYLEEHVGSDDADSNLKAAASLLEQKLRAGNEDLTNLETFTLLAQVENKCDHESYEILRKNDKLTGEVIDRNLNPDRRIEFVFYKIALRHAIECNEIYPNKYNSKQLQLDQKLFERVKTFCKGIINYEKNTGLWQKYISNEALTVRDRGPIAYEAIEKLAKYDPDVRFLKRILSQADKGSIGKTVDKEKVELLYRKYLIEPCRYYLDELGEDLFIPANYDAKLFHDVDPREPYFYFAWANYQVCQVLVHREYSLILAELVSIVETH